MSEPQALNWEAIHQKLADSTRLWQDVLAPPEETVAATLEKRAIAFANRTTSVSEASRSAKTVLLIKAHSHLLGIEIGKVQEVLRVTSCARVPNADPRLYGVIAAHNHWVNLVTPLAEFDPASQESSAFSHAILLKHPTLKVAIACHEVLRLAEIPESQWEKGDLFRIDTLLGTLLNIPEILSPWEKESPPFSI